MRPPAAGLALLGLVVVLRSAGAIASVGGPDAFGYQWADSDEAGITNTPPSYTPTDLRPLGFTGDDTVIELGLPGTVFPGGFPFYGARYSRLWLSSNGWLSFANPAGNSSPVSQPQPAPPQPNALVAFLWDDFTLEGANPAADAGPSLAGDAFVIHVRLARAAVPAREVEMRVALYPTGVVRLFFAGDLGILGPGTNLGIEDMAGVTALAYMVHGVPQNGANPRAGYAVCFYPQGATCPSCLNARPTALAGLKLSRLGGDLLWSWQPLPGGDVSAYRLYRDSRPGPPAPTRDVVAEVEAVSREYRDRGAIAAPPGPRAFYQAVAVSCLGDLEGPY